MALAFRIINPIGIDVITSTTNVVILRVMLGSAPPPIVVLTPGCSLPFRLNLRGCFYLYISSFQ
jgi:hypothetical protein